MPHRVRRLTRILLLFLTLLTIVQPLSPKALAAEGKFNIVYDLSYRIHEDGNTTVTQNFSLTNLTSNFYASEYQIKIGASEIYNLRVFDASGPLEVERRKVGNDLPAAVRFRNLSPGLDQNLNWTATYDTPDIAKKIGRVWYVNIPKPAEMESNTDYTLSVSVPPSFGQMLSVRPQPPQNFFWKKNDLGKSGVSMVFYPEKGEIYQNYNFSIQYSLYNNRLYPTLAQVALPPDTQYQKIFLRDVSPKPIDVTVDQDGNWLAKFYLGAGSHQIIIASGSAALFWRPSVPQSSPPILENNLKKDLYWETDDRLISLKARQLKNPKDITDYVATYLNYTPGKSNNRQGAKKLLLSAKATSSQDESDLFVALSRAAGIPTRQLDGILFTPQTVSSAQSSADAHVWSQYFDKESSTWQSADPTLQKIIDGGSLIKSFDLSHIALAIHGKSSLDPLPASAFRQKTTEPNIKIIPVSDDLDIYQDAQISYHADIPETATAGQGIYGKIFLENISPVAQSSQKILLNSQSLDIVDPVLESGLLPPFADREMEIRIRTSDWFKDTDGIINLNINYQTRSYPIKIRPFYKSHFVLVVGGLTILGILSIIAQITRSLLIQRRKGKDNLRR